MTPAPLFYRLPIIRHVRWLYWSVQVARWYSVWAALGYHDGNRARDCEVLGAIWRGEL